MKTFLIGMIGTLALVIYFGAGCYKPAGEADGHGGATQQTGKPQGL